MAAETAPPEETPAEKKFYISRTKNIKGILTCMTSSDESPAEGEIGKLS